MIDDGLKLIANDSVAKFAWFATKPDQRLRAWVVSGLKGDILLIVPHLIAVTS